MASKLTAGPRAQWLGLALMVVAPVLLVAAWIAYSQYVAHREALGQTLVSVARALAAAAEREAATALSVAQTLSHSPLVESRQFAAFHAFASKTVQSREGAWVVLFDASGQQVVSTIRPYGTPLPNVFEQESRLPPPRAGEVPRGGSYFVREVFRTGKPVYSDLFLGQVSGAYLVALSAPIHENGRVAYCITVAIPASTFQSLVGSQPRTPNAGAVIFDSKGFIIARADDPDTYVGRPVPAATLDALRESNESFAFGASVAGRPFFRAVVRSPVTGWGAGASVSEGVALGARTALIEPLLVLAALLAFAVFVAMRVARLQTRQLASEAENRAKDQFIAAMSHELRNPLSAIELATDVLRRRAGADDSLRQSVEVIGRQGGHLRRLLDDLHDVAGAIHGKLPLELRPVELRGAIDIVVSDYLRRPDLAASIRVDGGPAWARADQDRLSQIFDNLLNNALKYGARNVDISITCTPHQSLVRVRDDGRGIEPALLQRLFEPFVQGAETIERRQGGLGLGLALVRRLARLQGGDVKAESEGPGRGSVFTIILPLAEKPSTRPI